MNVAPETPSPQPRRQLSLVDASSLIVGVIIGSGIYQSAPLVAQNSSSSASLLLLWLVGGLLALGGALCYAELASAWPLEGGDFVYLSRAYGRWAGFLFAWSQLWVVRPGSIGLLAAVFGAYAQQLHALGEYGGVIYALAALVGLTAINLLGARQGAWTQNLLSIAKLLGLGAVVLLGFWGVADSAAATPAEPQAPRWTLALVFVLFAYGGWNEMPNIAAEVCNPRQNLWRALVVGTAAVTVVYLLLNLATLHALGIDGLRNSRVPAADVAAVALGDAGRRFVAVLVCISTLGSLNGMTLTGSRLYYALGSRHAQFARLGQWNARRDAPSAALLLEAAISIITMLVLVAMYGPNDDIFNRLVAFTSPVYWLFIAAAVAAIIVLRVREPQTERPIRVPLYPLLPLAVIAGCCFLVDAGVRYAWSQRSWEAVWPLAMIVVGAVLAWTEGNPVADSAASTTSGERR